jgi:hypothetical protein
MAGVVIVIAVLVGACSGGGKTNDTAKNDNANKDWDPAAVAQLKTLGGRISTHLPNQCKKVTVVPAAAERGGIEQVGGKVEPAAMVQCDVLGENEEVASFADAKTRNEWIDERQQLFCAASARHQVGFPGLHWVTGGAWSILTDTEGVGRRIARAINSTYRGTPCPGHQLDWTADAVTEAQGLADKIAAAGLGCDDYMVKDLDTEQTDPLFKSSGLPAVYGACTLRRANDQDAAILVSRSTSAPLQKLVRAITDANCPNEPGSAIVLGSDWVVPTQRDTVARRIAKVTGGQVQLCAQ